MPGGIGRLGDPYSLRNPANVGSGGYGQITNAVFTRSAARAADAFFSSDEQRCIMAVTNIPISKQGYKRLEEELAIAPPENEGLAIIQAIKEAREEGDLRENAGYDAARERQGMAEARISISSPAWLFARWSTWTS